MRRRILLKKTVSTARTGDAQSFENLYILTVQETYGKIGTLVKEPERAEEILCAVYCALYREVHALPEEEEELQSRIEEEIYRCAEQILQKEPGRIDEKEAYGTLNENQAATIWLKLEDRLGFSREAEEEPEGWPSYLLLILRIAAALLAVLLTGAILLGGWHLITKRRAAAQTAVQAVQETGEEPAPETLPAQEKQKPGWRLGTDGALYYVKRDGTPADGALAIGKQTLTFSRDGRLTMIGENREVAENGALSFDEEIRYEVRDGDVYRTDPETGETICAVRNGHVTQADVRCGYLWYISKYQVPNTDQTRTAVNRALPDGEEPVELYATTNVLETEHFQVSGPWLYYLSDGRLFRMKLENGRTEYLASRVESYFAWEDTAYYMKDRALEAVSRGRVYSGPEAGYRIETKEGGLVLLDAQGDPLLESGDEEVQAGDCIYRIEDGYIASVSPAERNLGGIVYFIEESGVDQKIYREDASGARSLLVQEGISTDCLCIAGEWLYYSARTEEYGDECESRIYRMNLETMESEPVGAPFRGRLRNLYYYESVQAIYGEYLPSVVIPEEIRGKIVRVSGAGIEVINDTPVRPQSEGGDLLEMVMAQEGRIFCLYHRCSYDRESGTFAWESTEPLEIALDVPDPF